MEAIRDPDDEYDFDYGSKFKSDYEEEYEYQYEPDSYEVPFKSNSEIIKIIKEHAFSTDPDTSTDHQPTKIVVARIECLIHALKMEDDNISLPIPYPNFSYLPNHIHVTSATFPVDKRKETISILNKIHELCRLKIHATKRDLFYARPRVGFVENQSELDMILDNCSRTIGIPKWNFNLVEANKIGVVIGKLVFSENGHMIDCTQMGSGGKAIPPFIDRVCSMTSDASYILLVDKNSTFVRLVEDTFYNAYPCIIVMAKGQDFATKLFLRKMKLELGLPVLALVDCDPNGLNILSVYGSGPKNMICPDIKWLGLKPSDLVKLNIPEYHKLPMTNEDIKLGNNMLENNVVITNEERKKELKIMLDWGQKVDIEVLSSFWFKYLTDVYLPTKLRGKDWI